MTVYKIIDAACVIIWNCFCKQTNELYSHSKLLWLYNFSLLLIEWNKRCIYTFTRSLKFTKKHCLHFCSDNWLMYISCSTLLIHFSVTVQKHKFWHFLVTIDVRNNIRMPVIMFFLLLSILTWLQINVCLCTSSLSNQSKVFLSF